MYKMISSNEYCVYCIIQDLQNINILIKSRVGGKRLLTEDDIDEDVTPIKKAAPLVTRRLHGLIEERLGQTKE